MKRPLALLTTALTVLALAAGPAAAGGRDTSAIVENRDDGSALTDLAFELQRDADGVIDQRNTAYAYASCADCRTAAVSFQIVLVMGPVQRLEPENLGIAVNEGCTSCETVGSAQQFVVGGGRGTRLTEGGRDGLHDVEEALGDALEDFEDGELTALALDARIDALADEVRRILDTELRDSQRTARHHNDDSEVDDDD